MKIVVTGGSGFLGQALSTLLVGDGHQVVVLTRRPGGGSPTPRVRLVQWTPNGGTGTWAAEIDGADAVVNLAGESIGAKRWSEEQKARIQDSRIQATRSVVEAINGAGTPPAAFVSASAVGYYGPHGDDVVTEETPVGSDFLARVCAKWEAEARRTTRPATRTVLVRTGLVLDTSGGALPKMLPPFKLGAGGPIGSGHQYWPWIHVRDWVDLVRWSIVTPTVSGPVNATAPNPVTNAEFARHLGSAIHRPAIVPTPAFVLRLVLGEMAEALLLSGQRALPATAQALSFTFKYSHLNEALAAIFSESS